MKNYEKWDTGIGDYLEKHPEEIQKSFLDHKGITNAGDQHDIARKVAVGLNKDPDDIGKIYNWLSGYYNTPFMYNNETKKYYVNKKYLNKGGKMYDAGGIIKKMNDKYSFKDLFTK